MTPLIDTHCHLADQKLRGEVEELLARAREAGVARIVSVGAIGPIETDRTTVDIAERYPNVFAAIGIHPHDAKDLSEDRLAKLRELAHSPKVVAIGESGLDFHYLHSPREQQEESLRHHLALARELQLPIVIHCREAEPRLAEIVRESGLPAAGGVIHCFTGDTRAARAFLDLGFHISFSGILTFKNAGEVQEAARAVPDNRILVETDAPYLAPEPYRGKRNEPAFVRRTFEFLAELRSTAPKALAERVTENASELFALP